MSVRALLASPHVYIALQKLIGGVAARQICLDDLHPRAGERMLDVGCGPAYYVKDLPSLEYHGFDTDPRYIEHARARFGDRARFYCQPFDGQQARRLGPFDGVLLMGLLHHLDDDACADLLADVAASLAPGGRVVALDTAVHDAQGPLSRRLALSDRGEHVRHPAAFTALAERAFCSVEGRLLRLPRAPSIYWEMTMRAPRPSTAVA